MKNKLMNLGEELKENKEAILLLTIVWIVLFESFSALILISGVIVSTLVILFTDHFLLDQNYGYSYSIGLVTLINYFSRLFYEIIVSGFQAIPLVLSGKAKVQVLTVQTKLKSELLVNLLTNCLTLTPGSLTISKKGSELKVVTFDPPSEGEDLREVIPKTLENILLEYEAENKHKLYEEE